MTVATALPGPIPGRPSGAQQRFAQTSVARQIAPITGSDTNSGLPGSPWKTWRRYLDYVGQAFIDNGAVHRIRYLEDAPASDPILPPNVGSTGNLVIEADPAAIVTLRSSTFTNVQVNNPAGNLAYELTDGALNWTPFLQKRIFDVNQQRIAWLLADIGGGTVRSSIPTINFVNGDAYQIQSVPTIGAISFTGTQVVPGGAITIADLSFASGCIIPQEGIITPLGTSAVQFNDCHLSGATGAPMQGTYNAFECMIVDPQWNSALPFLDHVGVLGGGGTMGVFSGTFVIAVGCVAQGINAVVESGVLFVDDFGVFDSPTDGVLADLGGSLQASGILYGAGNAGFGAIIRSGGSSVTWQVTTPTITGASGQVSVGGAVPTWAGTPIDVFGAVAAQSL